MDKLFLSGLLGRDARSACTVPARHDESPLSTQIAPPQQTPCAPPPLLSSTLSFRSSPSITPSTPLTPSTPAPTSPNTLSTAPYGGRPPEQLLFDATTCDLILLVGDPELSYARAIPVHSYVLRTRNSGSAGLACSANPHLGAGANGATSNGTTTATNAANANNPGSNGNGRGYFERVLADPSAFPEYTLTATAAGAGAAEAAGPLADKPMIRRLQWSWGLTNALLAFLYRDACEVTWEQLPALRRLAEEVGARGLLDAIDRLLTPQHLLPWTVYDMRAVGGALRRAALVEAAERYGAALRAVGIEEATPMTSFMYHGRKARTVRQPPSTPNQDPAPTESSSTPPASARNSDTFPRAPATSLAATAAAATAALTNGAAALTMSTTLSTAASLAGAPALQNVGGSSFISRGLSTATAASSFPQAGSAAVPAAATAAAAAASHRFGRLGYLGPEILELPAGAIPAAAVGGIPLTPAPLMPPPGVQTPSATAAAAAHGILRCVAYDSRMLRALLTAGRRRQLVLLCHHEPAAVNGIGGNGGGPGGEAGNGLRSHWRTLASSIVNGNPANGGGGGGNGNSGGGFLGTAASPSRGGGTPVSAAPPPSGSSLELPRLGSKIKAALGFGRRNGRGSGDDGCGTGGLNSVSSVVEAAVAVVGLRSSGSFSVGGPCAIVPPSSASFSTGIGGGGMGAGGGGGGYVGGSVGSFSCSSSMRVRFADGVGGGGFRGSLTGYVGPAAASGGAVGGNGSSGAGDGVGDIVKLVVTVPAVHSTVFLQGLVGQPRQPEAMPPLFTSRKPEGPSPASFDPFARLTGVPGLSWSEQRTSLTVTATAALNPAASLASILGEGQLPAPSALTGCDLLTLAIGPDMAPMGPTNVGLEAPAPRDMVPAAPVAGNGISGGGGGQWSREAAAEGVRMLCGVLSALGQMEHQGQMLVRMDAASAALAHAAERRHSTAATDLTALNAVMTGPLGAGTGSFTTGAGNGRVVVGPVNARDFFLPLADRPASALALHPPSGLALIDPETLEGVAAGVAGAGHAKGHTAAAGGGGGAWHASATAAPGGGVNGGGGNGGGNGGNVSPSTRVTALLPYLASSSAVLGHLVAAVGLVLQVFRVASEQQGLCSPVPLRACLRISQPSAAMMTVLQQTNASFAVDPANPGALFIRKPLNDIVRLLTAIQSTLPSRGNNGTGIFPFCGGVVGDPFVPTPSPLPPGGPTPSPLSSSSRSRFSGGEPLTLSRHTSLRPRNSLDLPPSRLASATPIPGAASTSVAAILRGRISLDLSRGSPLGGGVSGGAVSSSGMSFTAGVVGGGGSAWLAASALSALYSSGVPYKQLERLFAGKHLHIVELTPPGVPVEEF